jgi:DNA primase
VDIIGVYLPLKKAGANFTALCPFHKEKTPSFNVNPQKQIFHCFGCHKGGDVFTFVKEYENIGFMDAVRRLAERAKIPLEFDSNPGEQQSRHLKDQLLEIHEKIAQRWQNCLLNEAAGQLARDYLAKRSVSAEAIKLFRLGTAPDSWDDTVNWAKSKNYELELVEKAGLIIRKEETGNFYDRFRGRLMFPICDEQGRVIGFSGRILSGDEKTAKYVNSPETPIFTKSKIFFGLDKSKRAILDAGYAVVCEGQLDLIACYMAGIQNVVAPQGTAFTDQHARIIKRYVDEVVLCFDSDEAGQNAAVRSLDHLLASGLAVRVAVVPAPHDPDSFIKANGGEAFRKLVEDAEGFFDYYLNRLCSQNEIKSDKGRLAVLRAMAEAVHKTGNAVLIDTYARETAARLRVLPEAVRAEFKKIPHATQNASVSSEKETPDEPMEKLSPPSPHEYWLLHALLSFDELLAWAIINIKLEWIQNLIVRRVLEIRFQDELTNSWNGIPTLIDRLNKNEIEFVTELVSKPFARTDPSRLLEDIKRHLEFEYLKLRRDEEAFSQNDFTQMQREILNSLKASEKQIAHFERELAKPYLAEDQRQTLERRLADIRKIYADVKEKYRIAG